MFNTNKIDDIQSSIEIYAPVILDSVSYNYCSSNNTSTPPPPINPSDSGTVPFISIIVPYITEPSLTSKSLPPLSSSPR